MDGKIFIVPGNPNDANRDYLPEAIKGSDMVVNENGNSSQVYPKRLEEHTEVILGDEPDTWYEYVPASYDGSKKVPLVFSMHGGMMTGWGQAIYTSWTLVADREGFIVVFPNAHARRFWVMELNKEALDVLTKPRGSEFYMTPPPANPDDSRDMNVALKLIEIMKKKYRIDESRIYMQGMSMGDMMTNQFARWHGDVLAAQAGSGAPTWPEVIFDEQGKLINRAGPVAVWQSRLEHDKLPPHHTHDMDYYLRKNLEYWKTINRCNTFPQIKIEGEDNFAFYKGELADLVLRDVKNRDHGQTFDDAELVWDYLFSGVRRDESGKIAYTRPNCERTGDAYAIALAADRSKAYVHNRLAEVGGTVFKHQKLKYHGLNGGAIVRGEYFMVPVSFVAKTFDAGLTQSKDGCSAELKLGDGRTLQFARGSIGCVVDNRVQSMLVEAVLKDGELYIPIEWFCRKILNNHVSVCDDTLYITDHYAELSHNMATVIRNDILI